MPEMFETRNKEDGVRLSGFISAPEKPKAVMSLVHGFGEHCMRYVPMAEDLNAQGIAVVAIDLRGHGRSEGKRGVCRDYDLLRNDVSALLDMCRKHFPKLPHILYGHSMGGGLVLNYLLAHQQDDISAVIVSAPLLQLAEPIPVPLEWIVRGLRRVAPTATLSQPIKGDKVSSLPDEQRAYEEDPLNHGRLGVRLAVDMIEAGQDTLGKAKSWRIPLLLMHARNDQLTAFSGSEIFAKEAQNCQFIPFDNVEHEMHNDSSRQDVYAAMRKFIKAQI